MTRSLFRVWRTSFILSHLLINNCFNIEKYWVKPQGMRIVRNIPIRRSMESIYGNPLTAFPSHILFDNPNKEKKASTPKRRFQVKPVSSKPYFWSTQETAPHKNGCN